MSSSSNSTAAPIANGISVVATAAYRDDHILKDASEMVGNTPLVFINKVAKDLPARIGQS
jgi:hypothetical protein